MPEYIRAAVPLCAHSLVRTPSSGPVNPQQMPPTLLIPPLLGSTVFVQVGCVCPLSRLVAKSVVGGGTLQTTVLEVLQGLKLPVSKPGLLRMFVPPETPKKVSSTNTVVPPPYCSWITKGSW